MRDVTSLVDLKHQWKWLQRSGISKEVVRAAENSLGSYTSVSDEPLLRWWLRRTGFLLYLNLDNHTKPEFAVIYIPVELIRHFMVSLHVVLQVLWT